MVAWSATEMMLIMMLLSSGSDVLTLIDSADYFKARNIAVTTEKMVELAITAPTDEKGQIHQLLALRHLADEPAELKKAQNFDEVLKKIEAIAEGKQPKDPQGFAADYARRTAIALGSKLTAAKVVVPENSIRQDALNWFPKDVALVTSIDFRKAGAELNKDTAELRKKFAKVLPGQVREEFYKFAEGAGNLRLDRAALAYQETGANNNGNLYIRLTGKVDHKRLVDYLRKILPPAYQFKETKGFKGTPISLLWRPNESPAFAIIGDKDVVVAGPNSPFNAKTEAQKVVDELLDVQRGKAPNVLDGPLGPKLKLVSGTATALFVGQLPDPLRKEIMGGAPPGIKNLPKDFAIEMTYDKDGIKVKASAEAAGADEAKEFVSGTEALVQMGLAQLKNPPPLPPNFPNPDKLIKGATDLLKSIKVEAKGKDLTGSMTMSNELINAYLNLGLSQLGMLNGGAAPLPGKKKVVDCPDNLKANEKGIEGSFLGGPDLPGLPVMVPALGSLTLRSNVVACRHGETGQRPAQLSAQDQPQAD